MDGRAPDEEVRGTHLRVGPAAIDSAEIRFPQTSASQSTTRGDQFISLTPASQALELEAFTNCELGAKWAVRPNLNLTAAVFQLDRANTTTPDPNNPTTTILAGATRTRGAELAAVGQLTPAWQVSAGYTYRTRICAGTRRSGSPRSRGTSWRCGTAMTSCPLSVSAWA